MKERRQIHVEGIVQGVGFRPFIHALACESDLGGFVLNNSRGVVIQVEGEREALDRFLKIVREQAPRETAIERIVWDSIPALGEKSFTIAPSRHEGECGAFISPDRATCDECLDELFDPANRRHRYPFINCTNCGPRFSIIREVPYDREHTTMAAFPMCAACEREYHDHRNRRFHAQANACFSCGPELQLVHPDGSELKEDDPISAAARLLRSGAIIALKGIGGYHLACNALDDDAVSVLRRKKKREEKPFALMGRDLQTIQQFCFVGEREQRLLESSSRPIVLLRRQGNPVAAEVAPAQKYLGWMLPCTPLHSLLLNESTFPLVMTSGNVSEEPIASKDSEAIERLGCIADYFLVGNREIHTSCDDTVVRCFANRKLTIRRSRGYAPKPVTLRHRFSQHTLACGGHLKNTFCLAKDHQAFVSHHIGDLENYKTFGSFIDAIERLKCLFGVQPSLIAHDLHPDYLSTRYAASLNAAVKIGVQHHHAHIVSCMAEHGLEGPVIGVAFDGLGYGADGTLWGGEFLIADLAGYSRRAHL
ncbi:MAG TPA: carbamoyltransferase HypF, partial [Candidatus Binatia bacterium]|nr:carbamoyltransferase HypF [Candidatus Binatia bacterium]